MRRFRIAPACAVRSAAGRDFGFGIWLTAIFIAALALSVVVAPLAADAQQSAKVHRIAFLATTPASAVPSFIEAFRQGLRELGYVDGQNIAIEFRDAGGKPERLPDLAAELVRLRVNVIVSRGTQATLAAKQATASIPIVMTASGDPVGTGLVASLARPGGNITGLTFISPELGGKRLELLLEAVPGSSRVAVLWNSADPPRVLEFRETQAAARALGVTLQSLEVRRPDDLEGAFSAMITGRVQALIAFPDPITAAHRRRIVYLAAKHRLPAMFAIREFVEAGGLMSYGANFPDLFRHAATYVDKILKGAKPWDLPVEQPTKFELVINLKTAKALGLTIPQSILIRADEVIQ